MAFIFAVFEGYGCLLKFMSDRYQRFVPKLDQKLGLENNYIDEWLFMPGKNMSLDDFYKACDTIKNEESPFYTEAAKACLSLAVKYPFEVFSCLLACSIYFIAVSPIALFYSLTSLFIALPLELVINGLVGGFVTGMLEAISYFKQGQNSYFTENGKIMCFLRLPISLFSFLMGLGYGVGDALLRFSPIAGTFSDEGLCVSVGDNYNFDNDRCTILPNLIRITCENIKKINLNIDKIIRLIPNSNPYNPGDGIEMKFI